MTDVKYTKTLTEVRSYIARIYCPHDETELFPTGYSYPTNPPLYPHECSQCDYKVNLIDTYPKVEYK